jgi:hypothetical protein
MYVAREANNEKFRCSKQRHAVKIFKGVAASIKNRRFIVGIVGVYLFSVGFLSGMLLDHIQFDHAGAIILEELDQLRNTLHQRLMAMERESSVE